VKNALAVLAALHAVGADVMRGLPALARISAAAGRGERTVLKATGGDILLIDESYNANPTSVRAALAAMTTVPRDTFPRRVAVLGDMLELGEAAPELHRDLKQAVVAAGIDAVYACGPMMQLLFAELPSAKQGAWADTSTELVPAMLDGVCAGDVVMIKGSLGTRMVPLVEALRDRYSEGRSGG
jgi:UDP-N-acetylmuramoyl-tripeptide--D-alanyl-D-alanine ligase